MSNFERRKLSWKFKDLIPVDYANQRVLTTAQLADVYECTAKMLNDNFQRTKAQFKESVHYFKLTGEVLRQFRLYTEKNGVQISAKARALYLWTEEGALLHCKMINTQAAWNVFKDLVNFYFAHRNDDTQALKAEIDALKQENARLKNNPYVAKPIPLDKWVNFLFGDNVKLKFLGNYKTK